jgi:hypothetical protein
VLLFTEMTSAFTAESCEDDRTQGQKSAIKTAKSTVDVDSAYNDTQIRKQQFFEQEQKARTNQKILCILQDP